MPHPIRLLQYISWGHGIKKDGSNEVVDQERRAKFDNVDWSYLEHQEKMREAVSPKGATRVNILMGVTDPRNPNGLKDQELVNTIRESRFGLGHFRTLDQAYEFTAFSPTQHKMLKNRCGNLKWVPFEDSDEYNEKNDWGVNVNLQRRMWNETRPLLPPPPKMSKSSVLAAVGASARSRALVGPHHPYTNSSPSMHGIGWIAMLILAVGGCLQRRSSSRQKKNEKSIQ